MGFSRQEYWSGVPLPTPQSYKFKNSDTMIHETGIEYLINLIADVGKLDSSRERG